MDSNRLTITASGAPRKQSSTGPATQEMVKVAVLPPRLPPDMAPPTGIGVTDAFSWDEKNSWMHNERIDKDNNASSAKKFINKSGLLPHTKYKKRNEDVPPFLMREVPYTTWRKHYAKDANGRYQGTHAPAEDCLLLPEDVEKWRLGEPETNADKWTRGKAALPVYDDATDVNAPVPEYKEEPEQDLRNALGEDSYVQARKESAGSGFTADGKTSAQIIEEAKERERLKKETESKSKSWKNSLKKATEYTMMGAS